MDDDLISVVIPYYNNLPTLKLCLQGFYCQQSRFELHLVNDGGRNDQKDLDDLVKLVSGMPYCVKTQFHYLTPESPKFRAGAARNLGIKHASGSRVLCIDSDCIPGPNILTGHLAYGAGKIAILGCRRHISEEKQKELKPEHISNLEPFVTGRDFRYRIAASDYRDSFNNLRMGMTAFVVNPCFCWSCHMSFPTAEVKSIGGFWEDLDGYGGEDQELGQRLAAMECALLARFDLSVYHLDHPKRHASDGLNATNHRKKIMAESAAMTTLLRNGKPL